MPRTELIKRLRQVVQARMWSQGITIGVVIAAAAVSRTRMYRRDPEDVGRPVNRDHSWRDVIEMSGNQAETEAE
jgi:hypothetical protein